MVGITRSKVFFYIVPVHIHKHPHTSTVHHQTKNLVPPASCKSQWSFAGSLHPKRPQSTTPPSGRKWWVPSVYLSGSWAIDCHRRWDQSKQIFDGTNVWNARRWRFCMLISIWGIHIDSYRCWSQVSPCWNRCRCDLEPFKSHVIWLVVSIPLKNMKVSWDDEIPNIWKNNSHVPNHQPVMCW